MQGQRDGIGGSPQSRWADDIPNVLGNDVDVLALQEAGSEEPAGARYTNRRFGEDGRGIAEFEYEIAGRTYYLYWMDVGQQRNSMAIVSRVRVDDAVQLAVHSDVNSRPIMGVLIGTTWFFNAHGYAGTYPGFQDAGADVGSIVDRARSYAASRMPTSHWRVLGDFNIEPTNVPLSLQRYIVRTGEPTHIGRSVDRELDFTFYSDATLWNFFFGRGRAISDHISILIVMSLLCGRSGEAAASSSEGCGGLTPGYSYRLFSIGKDGSERQLVRTDNNTDVPHFAPSQGDWPEESFQVVLGKNSGTFKLKMEKGCLYRAGRVLVGFGSCDVDDKSSDWSFSDGHILDPYSNEAVSLGPAHDDEVFLDTVRMKPGAHPWRFEKVGDGQNELEIRAMPLGDSITAGRESSDNNGYRDELNDELKTRFGPDQVDFVGSSRAGTMPDPDNEGHPGWRIDEIASIADCTVPQYQPNVITLHAGTNDFDQEYKLSSAPQRMKDLIEQALEDSPKAAVVVAKVIPTAKAGMQPRIDAFNAELPGIVADFQKRGKHVLLVDTDDVEVDDGLQTDSHPNDHGYAKLGGDFYDGVVEAADRGWIEKPNPNREPTKCESPDPGDGDDGIGPGWRALGVVAPGMDHPDGRTDLADFDGDGRDDYVRINEASQTLRIALNRPGDAPGNPRWVEVKTDPPDAFDQAWHPGWDVHFADLDGDRDDDFVQTPPGGSSEEASIALNMGVHDGKITWFGPGGVDLALDDVPPEAIRFADVNGDGRDDYLRVGEDGSVHAYYNLLTDDGRRWEEHRNWAPGVPYGSREKLRLADVNGDRKADYLMVGPKGAVHAYINNGGRGEGGFTEHRYFANETGYSGDESTFRDISGDGKSDYVVVYDGGSVRCWLNRGGNV